MVLHTLLQANKSAMFALVSYNYYIDWDNEYGMSHCTHALVVISSAVFGWFQDSFIGIERDLRYSLQAGYQKGASYYVNASFRYDVVSRVGSASMSFYDHCTC